jgi:hypothetical protein
MKRRYHTEENAAKPFLERLAADRGTLITDEEYLGWRSYVLQTLARPPHIEPAVAIPWLICALVGVCLLVLGFIKWLSAPEETTMDRWAFGVLLAGLGLYFFVRNIRACRSAVNRPAAERAAEADELLRAGLITSDEHATIKQAIENDNRNKPRQS